MDLQDVLEKVDRLQAEVTRLSEDRIPRVDRTSRRRDQRLGGAFVLMAVTAVGLAGLGSASALDGTNTVFTDDIVSNAVTSTKIADGAVGGADVRDGGITSVDIKDGSGGSGDVLDGSVSGVDVRDGSLAGTDILNGTIGITDMAHGSVDGAVVVNETLSGADVTDGGLTGADIANESITGADVINGSVGGADVQDGNLTGADLADGSITGADVNLFNDNLCTLETVLGTAIVNADPAVPSDFTTSWLGWQHSCSGNPVRVKRFAKGWYEVDFGSPARLAMATLGESAGFISARNTAAGQFTVLVFDDSGFYQDYDFSILAY
jgi:uncharacterized protein YjbI with pentapeptide repeats